ncbi:hypothetical protein BN381_60040 [Candidatus Microthrix parvicella RN1]|uniref:Uncharacterized protein n=1 Tax=Candidatus Neomicrothrix parvicella RN1 TaxID=1229780 RepID=R4Z691_9ACTN|nr:hypothetical protein BN381_60040 [Candidatus Microthrix parvicella RN1]
MGATFKCGVIPPIGGGGLDWFEFSPSARELALATVAAAEFLSGAPVCQPVCESRNGRPVASGPCASSNNPNCLGFRRARYPVTSAPSWTVTAGGP